MPTLKPAPEFRYLLESDAAAIVTLEEHSVIGGLGTIVAEYLESVKAKARLIKIGIQDRFLPVGDYNYLLEKAGLTVQNVIRTIDNSGIDLTKHEWIF